MHFDNGRRELSTIFFSYVENPRITAVRSGRAGQAGVVSILNNILNNMLSQFLK